jgi:hypothetical protein
MTVSANAVGLGGGNGGGGPGGSGGGGGINAFGSAALQDTIVAGNSGGNCLGAMTDGGHDLSYPDATCPGANGDPKLGAPQDNGGPTATAALAAGSAAIDQVPASGAGCPTTDQRGTPRPQGPACDIGAFELGRAPSNTAPPSISGSPAVGQTLGCANGMWSNAPLSYAYLWLRNGTGIPGATTSTHQVLTADAAHHLSCRVTATNPTGSVSADSAALNVPAQSGRGNNAIASKLSVSPATFTAAGSGPSATTLNRNRAKRPKSGATVSYTLNVPAVVRFTVQQRVPGRTQGRRKTARCVAQTKRNRKTRKCTRTMTLPGAFTRSGNSAVNRFHFSGRLNGHKLKPGTYTLVATPTTSRHPSRAPSVIFRTIR